MSVTENNVKKNRRVQRTTVLLASTVMFVRIYYKSIKVCGWHHNICDLCLLRFNIKNHEDIGISIDKILGECLRLSSHRFVYVVTGSIPVFSQI